MKIKNQSGFTIIELMVVTAVMSVLMLGFGAYLYQQYRQMRIQETKTNLSQMRDAMLDDASRSDTLIRAESAEIQSSQ